MQDQTTKTTEGGLNKGLVFWGVILGLFTGLLGLAIAIFGDATKRRDRLIGIGAVWAAVIVIVIIAVAAGGGSSSKKTTATTSGSSPAASKAAPTTAPYKLRVTQLQCSTDSTNTRECTGTVTNISPKTITDVQPIVHWSGGTDSDLGTLDINPILPGQSSGFKVFTLSANPQITNYRLGFKKVFGDESDFPIDPSVAP